MRVLDDPDEARAMGERGARARRRELLVGEPGGRAVGLYEELLQ